ncbi:MAG: hypothetical protein WD076_02485 [Parvularculaceae bacterium]
MMKFAAVLIAAMTVLWATPAHIVAAQEETRAKDVPTTFEYYYRIKWGSLKEFAALYDKNHKPLLDEMQKQGFILEMKTEYPFTHLAGGPRWDMRVRITYRDAAGAINDPAWEAAWVAAKEKGYKDLKKFDAEEARRFSLIEEHWDVIVSEFPG